ncbi:MULTISPECIES: RDD family protein [Vibrio]|uniref:RDD family protein n=2 Tax=Vibrio cortegadensis TaxID=1328770 RepID=A0ABV4MAD7_9VIBR|nr:MULTISPECIES: RDD family protein [Vibrio]MDN3696684.1 RDD family protein [Vibrio cortegadensis]RBW67004.1 RDD family protein [Vibrionales bacterium C3R12]TKF21938.1 RDD family protein [Vibrio genomosp. F6]
MSTQHNLPPASLMRRLGALLYDALIVIAIEMMAAGIVIAILEALVAAGLLHYGTYTDASDLLSTHPVWSYVYTIYLVSVWVYFFVFFWTRAGQTLGMRAWKLRLQNSDNSPITTTQALIRLGTSGFGLANLAVPFDPQKRGFQDIWAKTEVVVLPKAN